MTAEAVQVARYFGAGIAVLALLGVGLGLGNLVAAMLNAVAKNPEAKDEIFRFGLIGLAFTEAIGLFALVVALLILFV